MTTERIKNLIGPIIEVAATIFIIFYFIISPDNHEDWRSYISISITITTILFLLYEGYIWKFIPWNRPYVLEKKYKGYIRVIGEPPIPIEVCTKQTLFSIQISTKTISDNADDMPYCADSITASIVKENGSDILYYTYLAIPTAQAQAENPIQHGTSRIRLSDQDQRITGKFWTSRRNAGDIEWIPDKSEKSDRSEGSEPEQSDEPI